MANHVDTQESNNGSAIVPRSPVVFGVQLQPSSSFGTQKRRKRKLRSSKVLGVTYNNRFIRRIFQDGRIEYIWLRQAPTFNTIPMVSCDGFNHELLEGWTVETRIRRDGVRKETYFSHAKVKNQFRAVKDVQKFLASMIDIPKMEVEEQNKANKKEVERFLDESYDNLINFFEEKK